MKRFVYVILAVMFAITGLVAQSTADTVYEKMTILGEIESDGRYQISCVVPKGYSYEAEEVVASRGDIVQVLFKNESGEAPDIELVVYPYETYNYQNINRMPYEEYVEFMYFNFEYEGAHISQSVTGKGDIYIISFDDEYRNEIYVGTLLNGHFVKLTVMSDPDTDEELGIDDSIVAEEILDSIEINKLV